MRPNACFPGSRPSFLDFSCLKSARSLLPAGVGEPTDFYTDHTHLGWHTQLSINLAAVILGTQCAIQLAHKQNRDVVVLNTASLAGLYPQSGSPIYATVKGAIVHMVRGFKFLGEPKEAGKAKARIVAICPSFSPTGMQTRIDLPLVPSEMVVDAMMHAIGESADRDAASLRVLLC